MAGRNDVVIRKMPARGCDVRTRVIEANAARNRSTILRVAVLACGVQENGEEDQLVARSKTRGLEP